jgi:hypothetical protein
MKAIRELLLALTAILALTASTTFAAVKCDDECLAGASVTASGDLLAFFWVSGGEDYQVVNVSALTGGQRIAGPLTSWQTPDGPYTVEHLAGASPGGELLVFWWSPRADWQVVNVSALTGGQRIAGPLTSWQVPDGPYTGEHLAGASPDGDLLVFSRSPRKDGTLKTVTEVGRRIGELFGASVISTQTADWQVVNVSALTGERIAGPLTSWVANGREQLAAAGLNNELHVFWRMRLVTKPSWGVCSLSESPPTSCSLVR